MNCPKCNGEFESVKFGTVEVERCLDCKGIWFDMLEKEDLVRMEGSEEIDIGSEQVGESHDSQRQIDCPKCAKRMIPMVDKDQFHIHYECCQQCFGSFFDAGEFRDLKDNTVIERFRQMLQTLRTNL